MLREIYAAEGLDGNKVLKEFKGGQCDGLFAISVNSVGDMMFS